MLHMQHCKVLPAQHFAMQKAPSRGFFCGHDFCKYVLIVLGKIIDNLLYLKEVKH